MEGDEYADNEKEGLWEILDPIHLLVMLKNMKCHTHRC